MRRVTGIFVLFLGLAICALPYSSNAQTAPKPGSKPTAKPVAKTDAKNTGQKPVTKPVTKPVDPMPEPTATEAANWRNVATEQDRKRIRSWWKAWEDALKSARINGFGEQIKAQGILLKPDAALPNPFIPPGDYKCRVIKLGSPTATNGSANGSILAFVDYPFFKCRITAEQAIFSLTKTTGSQRPVGLLFDDTEKRQIFLGTMVLGDETNPLDYATDSKRDMAGMVERIGPRRWRLVLPYPAYESLLDVFEIVPETP